MELTGRKHRRLRVHLKEGTRYVQEISSKASLMRVVPRITSLYPSRNTSMYSGTFFSTGGSKESLFLFIKKIFSDK